MSILRQIETYEARFFSQSEPSCFNRMVRVVRYRITVEKIEEPDEVIRARIQKLWDECDNHHDKEPLMAVGKRYGLELGKWGAKK
jgi:hypothetical protein